MNYHSGSAPKAKKIVVCGPPIMLNFLHGSTKRLAIGDERLQRLQQ
jgi:hypothetical protein